MGDKLHGNTHSLKWQMGETEVKFNKPSKSMYMYIHVHTYIHIHAKMLDSVYMIPRYMYMYYIHVLATIYTIHGLLIEYMYVCVIEDQSTHHDKVDQRDCVGVDVEQVHGAQHVDNDGGHSAQHHHCCPEVEPQQQKGDDKHGHCREARRDGRKGGREGRRERGREKWRMIGKGRGRQRGREKVFATPNRH